MPSSAIWAAAAIITTADGEGCGRAFGCGCPNFRGARQVIAGRRRRPRLRSKSRPYRSPCRACRLSWPARSTRFLILSSSSRTRRSIMPIRSLLSCLRFATVENLQGKMIFPGGPPRGISTAKLATGDGGALTVNMTALPIAWRNGPALQVTLAEMHDTAATPGESHPANPRPQAKAEIIEFRDISLPRPKAEKASDAPDLPSVEIIVEAAREEPRPSPQIPDPAPQPRQGGSHCGEGAARALALRRHRGGRGTAQHPRHRGRRHHYAGHRRKYPHIQRRRRGDLRLSHRRSRREAAGHPAHRGQPQDLARLFVRPPGTWACDRLQ